MQIVTGMLRLLIDQDFDRDILRGLARRIPELDALTAREVGLSTATDPELLAWTAETGRIIITHDRKTMPVYAADRIASGEKMGGVIVVSRRLPISRAIDDLEITVACSLEKEFEPSDNDIITPEIGEYMSNDPELLVGLSDGELDALAESRLAPSAQGRLDELLALNAENQLSAGQQAELDRLLDRVDQLTILKTRAKYTIHQKAAATRT